MSRRQAIAFLGIFAILFASPAVSKALELETRYATIVYEKKSQLQEFNSRLFFRSTSRSTGQTRFTVADDVRDKTDTITEKIETILEMFPDRVSFKMVLLPSRLDVQIAYNRLYHKHTDYLAFYSPKERTIFISVDSANIRVLAHEIAHVIMHLYFAVPPPAKIQEVLSQYAETHIAK